MLCKRKGLHYHTFLSFYHFEYQPSYVYKTNGVWWFGTGCWHPSWCSWRYLQMGNQSACHHYLLNCGCSQQLCSTISILSQALGTWILVGLCSFMTWSLMKKLIFVHISSTFWARLLRERPQGIAFLFVASFQKFWNLKEYTQWKMSILILCKADQHSHSQCYHRPQSKECQERE